jgi:hypothetical protein
MARQPLLEKHKDAVLGVVKERAAIDNPVQRRRDRAREGIYVTVRR